jgi:NAD-reducing hydrogenase large subunit
MARAIRTSAGELMRPACSGRAPGIHGPDRLNRAVRKVATNHLVGVETTEGLLNRVEVAIRACDPCLSCATFALGRMPPTVGLGDHA